MKFRKWIFKLLTGYDLIEYKEMLNDFEKSVNLCKTLSDENKDILRHAAEVNNLSRKIIDHYEGGKIK